MMLGTVAFEAIKVVGTVGVPETRRTETLVYICNTHASDIVRQHQQKSLFKDPFTSPRD